ncbi:MAG: hypothetical protein R2855_17275 [Thermomicrobiales bacterium]
MPTLDPDLLRNLIAALFHAVGTSEATAACSMQSFSNRGIGDSDDVREKQLLSDARRLGRSESLWATAA